METAQAFSRNQWLLIVTVLLSLYGAGQVWLVQVSSYRLWAHVGAPEFAAYHLAWWRSIWFVVLAPAGLVFLGALLMLWMRPEGVPSSWLWWGFALECLLAVGTAAYWGPLMARLANGETGLIVPLYRELMATHWIRVGLVSGYALLASWMLLRSVARTGASG